MPKRLEVTWTGLDAFQAELQALTPDLVEEANAIMLDAAQTAKAEITAAYPSVTGNLRRGLVLKVRRGRVFIGATLTQRAPHGWIYERGTKIRTNKAGANRGFSPAHPTFLPITKAHQGAAIAAVITRLYAHGAAQVTGEAA